MASINQAGAIVGTSCQINGSDVLTSTYKPFFSAGRVNADGAKAADTGRTTFTPSRRSAGVYWITYATAYPSANFVVVGAATNNYSFIVVGGASTTARAELVLYAVKAGVDTNTDNSFNFFAF